MSGFIPMQRGIMPYQGPAAQPGMQDRDKYQRYSANGIPTRYGQYQMTTRPMPTNPNGQMGEAMPGPVRGSGPMPFQPQGPAQGGFPMQQDQMMQYANQAMRPQTGGGLTVQGGRPPMPPPANQATGLLSEPARFGKFDSRRDQFQNMQSKIADYQASAATDPNYDQNQLNKMQGRLNYLGRMRRQGR